MSRWVLTNNLDSFPESSLSHLAICKETGVIALKGSVQERLCQIFVHLLLPCMVRVGAVKRPETVIIVEPVDHSVLGRDDGLVAMHTNHLLCSKMFLPGEEGVMWQRVRCVGE